MKPLRMHWPKTRPISTHSHCFARSLPPRWIHSWPVCDGVVRYKILMKTIAAREYEAIADKADRRRILARIGALTDDPRPSESCCLPESLDYRRICLARYRMIYRVDDFNKQVTVFRI